MHIIPWKCCRLPPQVLARCDCTWLQVGVCKHHLPLLPTWGWGRGWCKQPQVQVHRIISVSGLELGDNAFILIQYPAPGFSSASLEFLLNQNGHFFLSIKLNFKTYSLSKYWNFSFQLSKETLTLLDFPLIFRSKLFRSKQTVQATWEKINSMPDINSLLYLI